MTDTKELVERVREALEYQEENSLMGPLFPDALAALSELEERLEIAEHNHRELLPLIESVRVRAEAAERGRDEFNDLWHTFARRTNEEMARVAELEEALREIAWDGPNPGSPRSPELRWAAEKARAALDRAQP